MDQERHLGATIAPTAESRKCRVLWDVWPHSTKLRAVGATISPRPASFDAAPTEDVAKSLRRPR
jgi:hypothetical protein